MSRCSLCAVVERQALDKQLRNNVAYDVILPWLADIGINTSKSTLSRHAQHVLPAARQSGPKAVGGDFLRDVVAVAGQRMADGEIAPGIRDGIAAESELGRRADRMADRDLMVQLAQVIGGAYVPVIEGHAVEVNEYADDEAEDLELIRALSAGEVVHAPEGAVRDRAEAAQALNARAKHSARVSH